MATTSHLQSCEVFKSLTMLPLQLVLLPERAESAWPSPLHRHVKKRRNSGFSSIRRASNPRYRTPLALGSVQQLNRPPPTPKTFSRRRSRHLVVHQDWWMTMDGLNLLDLPHVFIRYCSTVVETVISTTVTIAQNVYEAASTMLQHWWGGHQEDGITTLEIVECQPNEMRGINDILEENNRLKRMLEFAMTSHVIMNEATSMLEDGAEDIVDVKIHVAEQERHTLALQLEELQEHLGDKDQEIERLRDGFVWATENLNTKEDEIRELHKQLEHYEAILKTAKVV